MEITTHNLQFSGLRRLTWLFLSCFLASAVLVAAICRQHADLAEAKSGLVNETELIYLPPPPALRILSLGQPEVVADLLWIETINYFAKHIVSDRQDQYLAPLIDTIIALDPRFKKVYYWAGVVFTFDGKDGKTNKRIMTSSRYLKLGMEQFPDDWEFPFALGSNYYFELRTDDPEQKKEWRRTGASYIEYASYQPNSPNWLPMLVASLFRKQGSEDLAIAHLEQVYLRTSDPEQKKELEAQIEYLRGKQELERVTRERKRFKTAWEESYPYVSADLFSLLGAKNDFRLGKWQPEDIGGDIQTFADLDSTGVSEEQRHHCPKSSTCFEDLGRQDVPLDRN